MMIEKKGERGLESTSSKKENIKHAFSEDLLLDLMYGQNRDKYDKFSNQYAYNLIDEDRGDEVIAHLEKFNPTRQLFEYLLEGGDIKDESIISSFKGLNKGTLEKILRYHPTWINRLKAADFGVDENTWMRYEIIAEKFIEHDYDEIEDYMNSFYKRIHKKYFSMNESELKEHYDNLYG